MDLQTELNTFITAKIKPVYATITNAVFVGSTSEEICLRLDPSESAVTRYLDGSIAGSQSFSILAKSKNQKTARDYLELARWGLDFSAMQQLTGALFGKIECVSVPVFVSKSDAGEFVFSASFALEYYTVK